MSHPYPIKPVQILISRLGPQGIEGKPGKRGKRGKDGLTVQGPPGERGPPGPVSNDFSQYIVKILQVSEKIDYTWAQVITSNFKKTVDDIKLSYDEGKLFIQLAISQTLYSVFIVVDQPGKDFIEVTSETGKNEIYVDMTEILPETRINISCLWI